RKRLVTTIVVLVVMLFAVSFVVGWLLPPLGGDKSTDKDPAPKPAAEGPAQTPTPADFNIAEARKSVVFIKCLTPGLPPAVGSGFLVTANGLIYTNRHVIQPDQPIRGTILLVGVPSPRDPDKLDYFRAEVVHVTSAKDPLDFALLKITARP